MTSAERVRAELDVLGLDVSSHVMDAYAPFLAELGTTRARDLLGWKPQVPLEEGIPRAVAWFREHRAAHPEEDTPVVNEGDAVGWKTVAGSAG